MKLPEFSVKRKVTASMMAAILVVLGAISFTRLGLDFFPDLEFPTVSVITTYSGAASEDIENVLTRPLEQVVSSVNRVKKVTSITSEGVSAITIEFEWGTNLDFAAQDVRDQIALYEQYLPEAAANPLVVKFSFSQFPVIFFGVTSDLPAMELRTVLEDEVAPRLERIDGVASARVFAMDEREILVDVDRAALESRGLTLDQVMMALGAENLNLPAGNIVERYTEVLVRTMGEFTELDDIRQTIIGMTAAGEPVYVSDIAEVKDTIKEMRYVSRIQNQNGVYLMISKRSGANTQQASAAVKRTLAELEGTIPGNPVFHVAMDQGDMIEQVTSNTVGNAWVGGVLAILMIFLFLRNWRPTLVIALAVPLSVIATFIALYAAGYTLNLLTLGGLALGIGMLVDNAIVVIENVYRHLEEGEGADEASIAGAGEVGMAITASTLTTIAVFFPMIFASGITGKMTQALGLSLAFSLLASLFVALTVVPLSTSLVFRTKKSLRSIAKAPDERQFAKAKALYRKWLDKALHHRRWVLGGALLALAAALAIVPFLGTEFLPTQDMDMILLKVRMPVGTALEETDRVVKLAENVMADIPEIRVVSSQIGSSVEQDAGDAASSMSNAGTHEAILWVGLAKADKREASDKEILERIRRRLPNLSGVKFEAIDMSQMMLGGSSAPVAINLFGSDLAVLKSQADQVVKMISDVEGLRDITHTMAAGKPEVQIHIDRERASRLGLSVYQVSNTVQTATLGRVATRYREASDEIDVRIRFQKEYRDTMDEVRSIPIRTATGQTIYLEQVADITTDEGPITINRENQARQVSVTANIVGRDLGGVVREIKARLGGFERGLPPGYFLEYGGSYEDMQEAFVILAAAFALAILLVYMIMASQFEHFTPPFIIMFTVPLGIIGVIVGLLVTGRTLSMAVLIGVIMLAGIAVNNGIVMIDYINQLIKRGVDKREAILQGATTRLRAVLLTALTTILGTLPMALSRSSGSEFRAPMGVSIAFGLTVTTVLTLFVIPVIYSVVNKIRFKEKRAAAA
ncbi:MAG: efflux RND transporter permease subunit [Candidatus Aminicenantes bacterium]|nr:efflux RND transporter permease subunit [Candidatus Aminicenantes bacterium]